MSKSPSYFDWELDFRALRKKKPIHKLDLKKENLLKINKIGISEQVYRSFLVEWKKKNLKDS